MQIAACYSSDKRWKMSPQKKKCDDMEIEPNRAPFKIPIVLKQHAARSAHHVNGYNNRNFDVTIMQTFWQITFSHYMDYRS